MKLMNYPCPECQGKGVRKILRVDIDGNTVEHEEPCGDCHGTGIIPMPDMEQPT